MDIKKKILILSEIIVVIILVIYITNDTIVTNTKNLMSLIVTEIIYFLYLELRSNYIK